MLYNPPFEGNLIFSLYFEEAGEIQNEDSE